MKHDDIDPLETQEWLDALESVLDNEGEDRAHYLMTRLGELASRSGTPLPYAITTPYRNTIPVTHEARMPGDLFMERRIRSLVRWNALAMVMRTNQQDPDLGSQDGGTIGAPKQRFMRLGPLSEPLRVGSLQLGQSFHRANLSVGAEMIPPSTDVVLVDLRRPDLESHFVCLTQP